ncbi:hypothetical protein I3W98_41600, partial [Streptomyces cavourensis]|nr:hypothetical protein [Streptomyces cavourensis]
MKTTTIRNTANPRRTTLAHLKDAEALQTPFLPEHAAALPNVTANPDGTSSRGPERLRASAQS